MTDIEKKALALVNEVNRSTYDDLFNVPSSYLRPALDLVIEQFEDFRREVSDAVVAMVASFERRAFSGYAKEALALERFIIAKPVDPLVEAWAEAWPGNPHENNVDEAERLLAVIHARGGKIVWEDGE